jgi:3-deoxy-D-manno-octulosonic acid (KDO) 8-phosphate synthase
MEVHEEPSRALSDGSNALPLAKFSALVEKLKQLAALTRHWDNVG